MDIKNLSPEDRAKLKRQLEAEEKEAKKKLDETRLTYKVLVDEIVTGMFKRLHDLSLTIIEEKAYVFSSFAEILAMKADIYGIKEDQQSHTFTSADGRFGIKLGYRVIDNYDDTKSAGVGKVQKFLGTLSKDENSALLLQTVMGLLKSDDKGNLKPSRVLELEKMANKSGDADFLDGIRIIKESYHPVRTCQFVTVSYKDENGVEKVLPLSMSAAE